MEMRQITVSFEKQLVDTAERILDDIGLGFQSGISVFLKRVVKEGGIAFLLQNAPTPAVVRTQVQEVDSYEDEEAPIMNKSMAYREDGCVSFSRRSNSEITEEMRDHIWTVFTQNKNLSYSDYQELAREVSKKTGMNQGSAYIYFIILSCFIEGKFNTRTMKFADLVYYVERILQEYTREEFASTIKSLESSVPYWAEKIPGRFSEKAQGLVDKYKPLIER